MKMMSTVACILKLVAAIFMVLQLELLLSNYYGVVATKHVGFVGCIENERNALLELKASLVVDNTSLLSSWDNKSDCCSWKGVVCSNQTGHVEMLDLNGYQFGYFFGEINASLLELQHLKYLNLSLNFFSNNTLPELFGSLSNLRFLDLHSSFLKEQFHVNLGIFPNNLARLSHLQYLDLSENDLEGTIPCKLGNLSHLQHLDLSSNVLTGTIPPQLGNLSHLQHLDLSSNVLLTGTIPPQLGNLSHLQHLDLSHNVFLTGTIPPQLGNLSNLLYLDLSFNDLVGTIPHQLESLSNIQELNLGYNRLKVNHVGGEWLSNLTLLTHLDLSYLQNLNSSHIWLQTIVKLPKIEELMLSVCDLSDLSLSHPILNFSKSLRVLDLSFNELHGGSLEVLRDICSLHTLHLAHNNLNKDISTILLKLFGCTRYSLQYLTLYDNQITGTFPDLSIFPSLIEIDISNNLLSGKVPEFLPSKLESLIFSNNSLEGGIPKSFGNLCSLRSLDMSSNKLSEDLSIILYNLSVGCAKYSLKELDLDGNLIIGTVPDMSLFSSLETLDLSSNQLNGSILNNSTFPHRLESLFLNYNNLKGVITSSHFGNMSMLKYLSLNSNSLILNLSENWVPPFQLDTIHLRSCNLGPNFPKWLQSQKYLQVLDISDNRISNVVPMWFWTQATNLRILNISYNNLSGTIPNLPIRFSSSSLVNMDSNKFEGSIPPFFQSTRMLQMSNNKFSEIHLFLCTNTTVDGFQLQLLDLSNNQLSRKLPDCWSNLKTLEFLDLSGNTLSGEVPSSMGSLATLKVLILRNNSLSGELPLSLKNCKNLVMLDLGDNRISGPIPFWLGQNLLMLSLRMNQFSGSLPQSLCELTNIQFLDLSVNNLFGPIFKCLKNFSAMSQNVYNAGDEEMRIFTYDGYGTGDFFDVSNLVALLTWKGAERLFKNNQLILRNIDLSSNHLTGDIPEEIGNLIELVSLNLSSNNLTGEITSKIGKLTSLDVLDLSRNHLFGPIPPSLVQIDRLSMLNLSHNNLSGRIPIGTQLQSFDPSSYEGNADLCGKPLDKLCPGDVEVTHQKPEAHEESNQVFKKPIYLSVTLGFITGFWGLLGSLLLSQNWRRKYALFLNYIIDTMCVFMIVNATKFQIWLKGLLEKFV